MDRSRHGRLPVFDRVAPEDFALSENNSLHARSMIPVAYGVLAIGISARDDSSSSAEMMLALYRSHGWAIFCLPT